ncbi:hypothetical protein HDU92_008943 [Lobulomyces angularis]|nr:hypothetical protein HDU92_008943 [Lobulomyces angularis]
MINKKSFISSGFKNLISSNKFSSFAKKSYVNGLLGAIGNTPLIKIKSLSEETGCNIFGKAEFMNPGGSIKDRAALFVVEEAEKKGQIKAGGTIVEGTAGNTGIGLAHVCRAKGYKLVVFMPNTQSKEKVDTLLQLGAEIYQVPPCPFTDPLNFNHQARKYAEEHQNAVWTNQFDNLDNKLAHFKTTGPEILQQCPKLDAFTCSTGSGGTLAGVTRFLKENSPTTKIYLADPPGSVLYKFVQERIIERTGDSSITEGIGQGRITANMKDEIENITEEAALHIPDAESIRMVFHLLDKDGIYIGASSALNVVSAVKVAKILGPGKNIVTMLCDGANRYASRLTSKSWLESKGLFKEIPLHLKKYIIRE